MEPIHRPKMESGSQFSHPQVLQEVSTPHSTELPDVISVDLAGWQQEQAQIHTSNTRQNIFDQFEPNPGTVQNNTPNATPRSSSMQGCTRIRSDSSDSNFTSVSQQQYKHPMPSYQVPSTNIQGLYLMPEENRQTYDNAAVNTQSQVIPGIQLQPQFIPVASNQQMPSGTMSHSGIPMMYQPMHQQVNFSVTTAWCLLQLW